MEPDGSLAVAIPVMNEGEGGADAVSVTKVTLDSDPLIEPAALPADLGQIAGDRRAVLQTRFGGAGGAGAKTLTVSGTYTEGGSSHNFSGTAQLVVGGPIGGTVGTTTITVPKQTAPTTPLPAVPIRKTDENNNELGPPVPIRAGAASVRDCTDADGAAGGSSGGDAERAAGDKIIRDTGTSQSTGVPPDPSTSVASSAGVVIDTNNTYVLFSVDNGATFKQMDPTTVFPTADGGLCCDQVVIYDSNTDLFFWIMQYWAGSTGNNRERIAYAHPAALISNFNAWTYFDLTNGLFNGRGVAGLSGYRGDEPIFIYERGWE